MCNLHLGLQGIYIQIIFFLVFFSTQIFSRMDDDQKKCGGLSLFGLVVIGMSVAAIVIGCLNINTEDIQLSNVAQPDQISSNCSVEPRIPYYLIVAGVLMLVLLILRLFFQVRREIDL